jgi:hypothetical protein
MNSNRNEKIKLSSKGIDHMKDHWMKFVIDNKLSADQFVSILTSFYSSMICQFCTKKNDDKTRLLFLNALKQAINVLSIDVTEIIESDDE